MKITAALGLLFWSASTSAAPSPTANAILRANKIATGLPSAGTLKLDYGYDSSGLSGSASYVTDLAGGAYVNRFDLSVITGANGFDTKMPWQTDVSGVSTDQEGGDRVAVAISEAYRNANLWWRRDYGGAKIIYVGRETVKGRPADHLAVEPPRGKPFEAWFDSRTHLLTQVTEPEQ